MPLDASFLAFAFCVWLGFTTQAATGFGSVLISLSLGALLYPIHSLVPLLAALSTVQTSILLIRHHEHIDRRLFLRRILPLMCGGMVLGLLVAESTPESILEPIFGALVVSVAARELWRLLGSHSDMTRPLARPLEFLGIVAAGVVHGIFAAGGPLLVYVLGRRGIGKAAFRSTLATVWLTLNTTLSLLFVLRGRLDASALPPLAALVPVVAMALVAGEWAHDRLDEERFRIVVFSILLLAGLKLLF